MSWVFTPAWSTRIIAAIALGLLVLAAVRFWRESRSVSGLGLRIALSAVLIWIMLNPQTFLPRQQSGKPRLIVLVDTSASMGTRDVGQESRIDTAKRVLGDSKTLAALNKEFVLDLRRFDRTAAPFSVAPSPRPSPPVGEKGNNASGTNMALGDATDIGTALMSAVSELGDGKPQAGVLLVSDGRATTSDTLDAGQLALAHSVPLWTWTLGGPVPRHDLWIETASAEALAFSGAEVELTATLREAGYPNQSFKVEVLQGDKPIETREVVPDTNGVARMSVRVKAPTAGEQRYVFRVAAQPEEADTANNERAVFLRTVGEKVRVLLAEGQPHWDTKFLVQSLKRDPNVDLTAVYRLNAARHVAVVSSTGAEERVEHDLFPRSAAAMNAFDVIILGRGADAFFDNSSESLLTDFVAKRGGSVVFARGKPYGGRFQPLAKLEPVAWGSGVKSGVKLRPTEAGRDHPIFDLGSAGTLDELLEKLPALDQASATLGEKPLAVVLASAADRGASSPSPLNGERAGVRGENAFAEQDGPVLVAYQRYGQGKALSLNASGLWRWAFRETGQEESEAAYRRFWISLLQWLLSGSQFMPGADVALSSARRYYSSDQAMQFLISTRNLDPAVYHPKLVINGGGKSVEVEPRARGESFVAEAGPFSPGTYTVALKNNVGQPAELSQSVEVVSSSIEKRELSADPALMRKLAETSGGVVLSANDIAHLPEIVRRWESARQLTQRQQPVWDRWWVLAGLIALLGAEWWLRRREGLL